MIASARLEEFRAHAEQLFARRPELRSIMAVVAQYYDDCAEDAVHLHVVASPREVPVWPHVCDDGSLEEHAIFGGDGDTCCMCDGELYLRGDSWHWFEFAAYCHEHAFNSGMFAEEYLPIAIARRGELAWVGQLQRPQGELATPRAEEPDAREAALLAEIRANPDDDGLLAVLADHRLERPGSGLGALAAVIPTGCATFERGILVGAQVFAFDDTADDTAVRDHPAWCTVRTLRYLPGSRDLTSPAMASLRSLGPIGLDGARALSRDRWRIERLHVAGAEALAALAPDQLPHLRELIVEGTSELALLERWRGRLERLVLARRFPGRLYDEPVPAPDFTTWPRPPHELRRALGVATLASCDVTDESAGPTGIELAFVSDDAAELRVIGWHPYARNEDIARVANAYDGDLTYVSTPFRIFTADDERRISWY